MKLFKDILIEQKLEKFEIPNFDQKIEIIKKWLNDYEHGSLKKDSEISRAPGFNQDFFLDILGYVKKPSEIYSFNSEYLIEGKRPDGVLGFFKQNLPDDDNVFAVVELKGALNKLDKPQQREKNITPIEQAFGYKRHLRKCPFVIVSNFYEIRLFNDNELDYEIWNLYDLVDSKNDYFNFKKFYYLLCAKNFIKEQGISNTESLLSEIRTEEDVITKKFYEDYKKKRHLLLQNIYQKNEITRQNPDLLIEKGQKIIDRVIFMCFCEDRGLLPVDILQKIKADYKKSSVFSSSWDALKSAFNSVDKGNEKWDLPDGYNGGLFKNDEVLNDLRIGDEILTQIIDFSGYDFKNEMSVNILGHIFEQSISELEEIKIKIIENKGEIIETTNKTSKRKKDGIFYTPEYIVDYIVKNSLGSYLRENEIRILEEEKLSEDLKEEEYKKREQKAYIKYQEFLSKVKVLDPACGSGAFLVKVFDYLLEENQRVGKILGGLFNNDLTYKSILENNIYGVDLNQESVEITKLSLWLKSAQPGKKLNNLDNNIKCGNSLIDDPKIAGNKAFNWEKEFSEIMQNGGFDVIVGNPPYGAELSKEEQNFLKKRYNIGSTDTAILFIKKSFSILKMDGKLGFIIPKAFCFASNYEKIRNFIWENIHTIIDCSKVWKEVKLEQVVILLNRKSKFNEYESGFAQNDQIIISKPIDKTIAKAFGFFPNNISEKEILVGFKILKIGRFLGDFIINKRGVILNKFIENGKYPVIGCKELGRYSVRNIRGFINKDLKNTNAEIKENSVLVQGIVAHIENPVDHIKIIANISYSKEYFIADNINQILLEEKFSKYFVWVLLNSKLLNWYCYRFIYGKSIRTMRFDNPITSRIPVPKISFNEQKIFIDEGSKLIELNKEFSEKLGRFLERIKGNYKLEKPSEKIEKFYELSFSEFVTEMRKKGGEVPLSTQDELENYFNEYKEKILKLKSEIEKIDKKIDEEVYKIYRLSEDEIRIIEK
ncbi:MAG: N-6 DNA methylase [Minisyncoccia bacterium]